MRLSWLVGAALLAGGCASIQKERGHAEVAALVEERLGRKTRWNQGTPEDAEVARHLDALLKEDLTSDHSVEVALLNNPALQATYEDLGVSQADMVQAGLLSNPTLDGSIGFPISGRGVSEHEVSLVQDFVDLFTLPLRKRVAREQFMADTLRVAHETLATAAKVRKAFSEVQALQQLTELRRMALQAAVAAADLSARLRTAGNITELELASEQAAAEGVRLELAEGELALVEARENLNRLMGLWGPRTQWTLSEKLPPLPDQEVSLAHLESLAIRQRLDIAAARKQVMLLWNALELARSARFFGRVEVGVHEHQDADGPRLFGPTLSLELPIFDQRQALIARLEAQHRQGERRLMELSVNTRSEVRAARARLLALRLVADRYRRVVLPLREKVVEQSQLQYNAMQIGLFQLLSAKRDQVEAYQGYIEAVRDYWMARADLEQLVGGRLREGSAAPTSSPSQPSQHVPPGPPGPPAQPAQPGTPSGNGQDVTHGTESPHEHPHD
ncbi:TolC family protein [Myxococcus virescens]|uniref:Copper resistance-related lipoprotein n=1 Tax=Myxococcus virescens TaxID=83456 RepID=A0A511H5P2_9BACT|nr:TolC family protein [Myxococcus virescens]GEL68842.1 copper resistance-related lipoprotein [Myxococcus virescens]SDE46373.1 outer membrane protein, cobalt-zinc-cadmium efflux system [Myxococcus virescens]